MVPRGSRSVEEEVLLRRAAKVLPAGVRHPTTAPEGAMVVQAGVGPRIVDCSGNAYLDYLLGSGSLLLGHAHPAVVGAVAEALARGSHYLVTSEPAIRLAEEIVRAVPCAEKVSFHSTGSEATFFAMRLARAFRQRDRILKFEGAYHGTSDYALMATQWTRPPRGHPMAVRDSAGIPSCLEGEVLVAPFNDIETTTAIVEKHRDTLAGVIVEPLQRTIPPVPGFLEQLRELTRRHGIPLIFDEMVTGFRLAYGGAQAYYGVVPDLSALGKSFSSGFPITALCGRAELMDLADPTRRGRGDPVRLTGTWSGNPIGATAALATLEELRREGSYARLFAAGQRLMDALRALLREAGVPAQVTGEPPAFEVWFTKREIRDFRSTLTADAGLQRRFAALLLERGVVKAHEKFFLSLAHGEEEIETTVRAFRSAIGALAAS